MPELSVVVLTTDEEYRALLQVQVDGTAIARMTHSFGGFPQSDVDPIVRRIQELKSDVILVDLPAKESAAALRSIEIFRNACPRSAVFALGEMTQPQLIVNAMRAGAQEFLPKPTTIDGLLDGFNRMVTSRRRVQLTGTRGRVFVVLNAKGGNGATSVAVNLALAFGVSQPVALLDMAPLGNASLHLNLKPGFTIMDALNNLHRLDASLLKGFMARHDSGLHLLAGHPGISSIPTGPTDFARLFDVIVNQYQYVIVDASTRLDLTTRALCDLSDIVLLVANPDLASLWSAARVREFFTGSPAEQKLRIVLNRYKKKDFGDSDIEEATQAKIIWKIPNQYAAMNAAIERGIPLVQQNKSSEMARCFVDFSNLLAAGGQMGRKLGAVRPVSMMGSR
ncbi:MAG: AAA family ATPase [Terriglobales bacterium]